MTDGPQNAPTGEAPEAPEITGTITVLLIPQAATALQKLHDRTELSQTDLVNRAFQWYAFQQRMLDTDHEFILRDPVTGETWLVVFKEAEDATPSS